MAIHHRPSEKTEPVTSTVAHAGSRGLVTTLLVSVGCRPRSRREDLLAQPRNAHEGYTLTVAASSPRIDVVPHPVLLIRRRRPLLRRDRLRLHDGPHEGWQLARTRGSHRQYKHPSKPGTVTVAGKPSLDVPPGTLNAILKQAGLKKEK